MPSFPIKLRGKYAIWSTIIDQPTTVFVDSLDDLRSIAPTTVTVFSAGSLAEIERIGVPWLPYGDSEQLIRSNAAGDGRHAWALAASELLARFANTDEGRQHAASN